MAVFLHRLYQQFLLQGRYAAEHRIRAGRPFDFGLLRDAAHIDKTLRLRKARLLCQRGNGCRVIAGHQLQRDALFLKIRQRFGGARSDRIGNHDIGERLNGRQRKRRLHRPLGEPGRQNALAGLRLPLQVQGKAAAQPLRRADHKGSGVFKFHGAPLPLGGKWDPAHGRTHDIRFKIRLQRLKGGVVVVRMAEKRTHPLLK